MALPARHVTSVVTAHASRRSLLLAGAAAIALAAHAAQAQTPQGGTVAHGSASIVSTPAETRVRQTSTRAVLDWRSFDVGRDHRVAFDQPGPHAATLNRVHSGRESTIAGQITAPGTVIIQNTHGVVFTGTARVDVGGLVASSRGVDAGRFMADGRLEIRGGEAAGARIENQGSITVREAGLAALVGGRVANSGAIVARRGTVALASGETTTIDLAGDGVVRIAVAGEAGRADAGVANTGLIDAGGGRVVLTAGAAAGLLSAAINTAGVIRAASADGAGGTIELVGRGAGTVRVAGSLDATGATRGGAVTVTGQHVEVAATARVAASGRDAGGSVRIGGDRPGTGALRRAETTTVEAGARIEARATEGRGGSVVLWADRTTRFDGAIDVTGPLSGGFAETSAIDRLEIGDAAAVAAGPGGQWLIDPLNITINAAQAAAIVGTLNGGADVTVTTDVPGPQPGNLVVASPIAWAGDGDLTLFANNDLTFNAAVTSSGAGSLSATAGRDVVVNGSVAATGTGSVTLRAETRNLIASNAGDDRHVAITTTSGALRLEAPQGSVLLRRLASASTRNVRVQSVSGDIDIIAGSSIQVRGNLGASWARVRSETGAITMRAPSIDVRGGSGSNAFAEVVAGAGGSLTIEADRRIRVLDGTSPARVFALNGADLTMRAPEQVWNGQVRSGDPTTGNGGDVTLAGQISADVSPIFNLAPGNTFTFESTVPGPGTGTTASRYTSPVGLRVDTRGTGEIDLNAPVTAAQVALVSEERVTLAPGATVTGTAVGDAVVIAAGRGFDNQAGSGALAAPNGRWLLFLDTFDGMLGTEPATAEFDLYNRPFDYGDPARADVPSQIAALDVLGGSRIIYGEQPVITVTGETLAKTYGTAVSPAATIDAAALRPKDAPLATVLVGGTTASSAGAPADADAGVYATAPVASLSARGSAQGYGLVLVPGTLTVAPAPLTVTANDATRVEGQPNPAFSATITGFVLGQDASVLGGTLSFSTPATIASPPGTYAITPFGLTGTNYAITFIDGLLTVTAAAPPPAVGPQTGLVGTIDPFRRGVQPYTPGDAGFRTTVLEAGQAVADPFRLTYALGDVVQLALGEPTLPGGFVPAGAARPLEGDASSDARCGGPINVGVSAEACRTITVRENFWTTRLDALAP